MYYRRNADFHLRDLEREFDSTGDPNLLIQINRVRRRASMPPHPASRIEVARNFISEKICNPFAGQVRELYDDFADAPMYLDELPEGDFRQHIIQFLEYLEQFREDWRVVSDEAAGMMRGVPERDSYLQLLKAYNLQPSPLGPEVDIPEAPEGYISLISPHAYRSGMRQRAETVGLMFRLVCERAIRIARKLFIYGIINTQQVIQNEPEFLTDWSDSPIGIIDEALDQLETAQQEIDRTLLGIAPSPEAVELFAGEWYKES